MGNWKQMNSQRPTFKGKRKGADTPHPNLCRIRQRRLVQLGSPQGERRGFDVDKATTGRGAHQTCHSTKRTHRFLANSLMEAPVNTWVAAESCERNGWFRFEKQPPREGVLPA